jgi:uncharacterized protein (DUF488 family)
MVVPVLSTIGYEGASLDDFLATLQRAGVAAVIDIRDVPASRRPGFSKNVLAAALASAGVSYTHLKPLGDPKPGREAARRGDHDEFVRVFTAHVASPQADVALQQAVDIATSKPSVLLCYERDPRHCHRTLVARMMKGLATFEIRDLGVQKAQVRSGGTSSGAQHGGVLAVA